MKATFEKSEFVGQVGKAFGIAVAYQESYVRFLLKAIIEVFVLVCIGMYWYVWVFIGMYWYGIDTGLPTCTRMTIRAIQTVADTNQYT